MLDKKQIEKLVREEVGFFLKENSMSDFNSALSSTDRILASIDNKLSEMIKALQSVDMSMDYVAAGLFDEPTVADIELTQRRRGRMGITAKPRISSKMAQKNEP